MESESSTLNGAKRKALQSSVASLCVESGYISADRAAIEVLTQLLQGYICEVGKTARSYCEMAQRLEPIVSDVEMALVDVGSKYDGLQQYAMRFPRRHLGRQSRNYPTPQPKALQVGSKTQKPTHVPNHLPSFPDQHTYIKTPIFPSPEVDYRSVKERISEQHYHSTKSLSRLLAKTQPSRPISGDKDVSGHYSVLLPDTTPAVPVYISALVLPSDSSTSTAPPTTSQGASVEESTSCTSDSNEPSSSKEGNNDRETDLNYINPYLRPPSKAVL